MGSFSTPSCGPEEGLPSQLGDYVVQTLLGQGSFGKVAKCLNSRTGEVVALKVFENGVEEDAERELAILQHLNDTIEPPKVNIVKYIEHFTWENYYCIAYEILDRSLWDLREQRPDAFSLSELRPMAQQLLVAFEGLREAEVVHADLKPDNIVLVNHKEQPFKVKLIDFGCGGFFWELEQGMNLMPDGYRAPEVTLGAPLSETLDRWSLGCCLVEGFLDCQLFSNTSSYDNLRTIIHLLGEPSDKMLNKSLYADKFFFQTSSQWTFKTPIEYQATNWKKPEMSVCPLDKVPNLEAAIMDGKEDLDEEALLDLKVFMDFVKNLLQIDPEVRLTASAALTHPFITMEHLTNSNSEYVRQARDLMSVALQTSAPAPVKDGANGDQEEQLGSCSNKIHKRMETHEEVAAPEHVMINLADCSEDGAHEPETAAPGHVVIDLADCSEDGAHELETAAPGHVVIDLADCSEDGANGPKTAAPGHVVIDLGDCSEDGANEPETAAPGHVVIDLRDCSEDGANELETAAPGHVVIDLADCFEDGANGPKTAAPGHVVIDLEDCSEDGANELETAAPGHVVIDLATVLKMALMGQRLLHQDMS